MEALAELGGERGGATCECVWRDRQGTGGGAWGTPGCMPASSCVGTRTLPIPAAVFTLRGTHAGTQGCKSPQSVGTHTAQLGIEIHPHPPPAALPVFTHPQLPMGCTGTAVEPADLPPNTEHLCTGSPAELQSCICAPAQLSPCSHRVIQLQLHLFVYTGVCPGWKKGSWKTLQ